MVRVYSDASADRTRVAWGAVVLVEGMKPHVMGGPLRRRNGKTPKLSCTFALEMMAALRAQGAAKKWLRRHDLRAELLVQYTDNEGAEKRMREQFARASRITYSWLSREHPMMRLADGRARAVRREMAKQPTNREELQLIALRDGQHDAGDQDLFDLQEPVRTGHPGGTGPVPAL